MKYFVDKRTNDLKEINGTALNFLAPEMYHYYSENNKDMFTETWCVGENEYIDVSYTQIDIESNLVNNIRENMFKKNNTEPLFLKEFSVPTEIYKKVLEEFGYKYEKEN